MADISRKLNNWLSDKYGSRRGAVRTFWYKFLYYLGVYRQYRQVDWHSVDRLIFVCKGNICRSAYAEAVAKSLGLNAISCGIDAIDSAPANADAMLTARKRGFDLSSHRTQPVSRVLLGSADMLIAMEPWQANVLSNKLAAGHQCTLAGVWSHPVLPHIQDPYGASSDYFNQCFKRIENSIYEIANQIQKK